MRSSRRLCLAALVLAALPRADSAGSLRASSSLRTPVVTCSSVTEAPAAVKLATADVGSLRATSETPLIILHGLYGAGGNFQTWAKKLAQDYEPNRRIVLVDLRNHGDSEHASDMSFSTMAADVIGVLDQLSIERAVFCGHSLGGKVAMTAALLHPERVERLMVLDMAPVTYSS